jgi:TRAP-type mannitol/chloroaromatic compound transport system permease large subunit
MSYAEALGLIMLVGMVAVIFIGFPISFTLLFLALIFGGLGLGWEAGSRPSTWPICKSGAR